MRDVLVAGENERRNSAISSIFFPKTGIGPSLVVAGVKGRTDTDRLTSEGRVDLSVKVNGK